MTRHGAAVFFAVLTIALLAACGADTEPVEPADLAIVAATATGAGRMPPVGEADFGTLTAGMSADLIVLTADPLAEVRNTLRIDRVMLRGEWVDRDALLPSE